MRRLLPLIALLTMLFMACSKDNTSPTIPPEISNDLKVLNWLKSCQLNNGLIPSSKGGNVSLYDNALAALAFMIYNEDERAEKIFDFFNSRINSEFKVDSGGFSQFRDQQGFARERHQWMGDNAWLLIALNNYKQKTGSSKYDQLSNELVVWLQKLQNEGGGLYAGYDGKSRISLEVTEGIIDAFNAVPGYTDFHKNILKFLKSNRYDAAKKSLTTGWDQYPYALDLHPWAFCIFEDFPAETLDEADMFRTIKTATVNQKSIEGFCFDSDLDNVWYEGVGEMIVAYQLAGKEDKAKHYQTQLEMALITENDSQDMLGIPYASNGNSSRFGDGELSEAEYMQSFVSSCTWYLFGIKRFNPFETGRKKAIPSEDKFWVVTQ